MLTCIKTDDVIRIYRHTKVADAKELLESERGYDAVSRAVEAAKLEGIHSIPVFVFTSGTSIQHLRTSDNLFTDNFVTDTAFSLTTLSRRSS